MLLPAAVSTQAVVRFARSPLHPFSVSPAPMRVRSWEIYHEPLLHFYEARLGSGLI